MNFVFLDIDGVLNNLGSVYAFGNPSEHFDPVSVALIERLCCEGCAYIVMSTSWRNGDTDRLCDELRQIAGNGLADRIIGEIPYLGRKRGEEIAQWIKNTGMAVDEYVIIDDDDDMLPDQPFVQTTFEDGFRLQHYREALKHLDPDHQDVRDGLWVPAQQRQTQEQK